MPRRRIKKKEKKEPVPKRGDVIKFVKGSYMGCLGWINKAKEATDHYIYVIIDNEQPVSQDADYTRCVKKDSVLPYTDKPNNWEEYLLNEDEKCAMYLQYFAMSVADGGAPEATSEMLGLVAVHINLAIERKKEAGSKAKYSAAAFKVREMVKAAERAWKRSARNPDEMTDHES